jgi:hypothetical protein
MLFNYFRELVRVKGLEPPRHRRQNLNLVRLPIPPHPHLPPSTKHRQQMPRQKFANSGIFSGRVRVNILTLP